MHHHDLAWLRVVALTDRQAIVEIEKRQQAIGGGGDDAIDGRGSIQEGAPGEVCAGDIVILAAPLQRAAHAVDRDDGALHAIERIDRAVATHGWRSLSHGVRGFPGAFAACGIDRDHQTVIVDRIDQRAVG